MKKKEENNDSAQEKDAKNSENILKEKKSTEWLFESGK